MRAEVPAPNCKLTEVSSGTACPTCPRRFRAVRLPPKAPGQSSLRYCTSLAFGHRALLWHCAAPLTISQKSIPHRRPPSRKRCSLILPLAPGRVSAHHGHFTYLFPMPCRYAQKPVRRLTSPQRPVCHAPSGEHFSCYPFLLFSKASLNVIIMTFRVFDMRLPTLRLPFPPLRILQPPGKPKLKPDPGTRKEIRGVRDRCSAAWKFFGGGGGGGLVPLPKSGRSFPANNGGAPISRDSLSPPLEMRVPFGGSRHLW